MHVAVTSRDPRPCRRHICLQAHRPATTVDQHVQLLYAAALERLLAPIASSAVTRALQPLRKQHEDAAAAAAEVERQQCEEAERQQAHLREMLLQDLEEHQEEGEEEAATAALAAALPLFPGDDGGGARPPADCEQRQTSLAQRRWARARPRVQRHSRLLPLLLQQCDADPGRCSNSGGTRICRASGRPTSRDSSGSTWLCAAPTRLFN